MTLHLRLFNVNDGTSVLVTTIDTATRRTFDLTIDPADLPTAFIALNALLGTLEAHLQLQQPQLPAPTIP